MRKESIRFAMRHPTFLASLTCLAVILYGCGPQPSDTDQGEAMQEEILEGAYLGQEPPGMTPEVFAPGIVSTTGARELNAVFTPDGHEFFFTRALGDVLTMFHSMQTDGTWAVPQKLILTGQPEASAADMMTSLDGSRLYFLTRATNESFEAGSLNIWVSRREGDSWSDAQILPEPVNSNAREIYPCLVADGSLYFSSNREGGHGDFDSYRAQYRNGTFTEAVNLGPGINTGSSEGDIFVSPDEQYLIVTSDREGGKGNSDLYISFRTAAGDWGELTHMGDTFNSENSDYCPMVTPDGKYFFYTQHEDVYWVDAQVLEQFRPGGE